MANSYGSGKLVFLESDSENINMTSFDDRIDLVIYLLSQELWEMEKNGKDEEGMRKIEDWLQKNFQLMNKISELGGGGKSGRGTGRFCKKSTHP